MLSPGPSVLRSPAVAWSTIAAGLFLAGAFLPAAARATAAPPTATAGSTPPPAPKAASSASPSPSSEVADLLETAEAGLQARDYKSAIRDYRQADKLSPGGCVLCQLGLAKSFNGIHASKDALKSVDKLVAMSTDRKVLRVAYNEQGLALLELAGEDGQKLQLAEAAFRKSLELGESSGAYLNLGMALLRQGRDADGVEALEKFLALEPESPHAEKAKELIANPVRARKRLIPDLELVSLAGEYLTTEDLRGKVLLLDFWGTWCAPCRAAIPDLRSLSARLRKSPFVLISVSNDSDVEVLKRFIAENRMEWPQVWDERHETHKKLGVSRFPTYLLVDHEGEIVYVASGWGPQVEREIEQRVRTAVGKAKKSAASPAP